MHDGMHEIEKLDTHTLGTDGKASPRVTLGPAALHGSSAAAETPSLPGQAEQAGALRLIVPPRPAAIAETGLDPDYLQALTLRHVVDAGALTGNDLAERLRLPLAGVVEELIGSLRRDGLLDNVGVNQQMLGAAGMKLRPTERGMQIDRRIRERDGYVGPAPVARSAFRRILRQQAMAGRSVKRADVWRALSHLVLPDALVDRIGAALEARGPLLLAGPSGNGKTSTAAAIARMFGGGIFVPHAVEIDGQVVRIYDPSIHKPLPAAQLEAISAGVRLDERWVYCQMPFVRAGVELAPSAFDLTFDEVRRFYETPLQFKAAGGVLLLDDLGGQETPAATLVSRVLEPLASGVDYLRTVAGRQLPFPFTPLVVLATSGDPAQLFGEATLRRLPSKIRLENPSEEQFAELMRRACAEAGVEVAQTGFQYIMERCYAHAGRARRASHPSELARLIAAAARYYGVQPALTRQLVDVAAEQYFG